MKLDRSTNLLPTRTKNILCQAPRNLTNVSLVGSAKATIKVRSIRRRHGADGHIYVKGYAGLLCAQARFCDPTSVLHNFTWTITRFRYDQSFPAVVRLTYIQASYPTLRTQLAMRNPWLLALFACAALAHFEGKTPQSGIEPLQYFPPQILGQRLPKRAAFANPDPQSTCGNYIPCGSTCIPAGYTCCQSGGGCPSTHYCTSGGCCERGKVCSGTSGDCPDGTKSCAGATCIPNADPCPTLTAGVSSMATTTGSGGVSTSMPQPGQGGYSTSDGTCVAGFKLCGTYWCIENEGACCNNGLFACAAGAHCATTACADTCSASEKQCGHGCIASDSDCCGNDGSSCSASNYCSGGLCYEKQSTRTLTEEQSTRTLTRNT
jgi:hypothetical protein